MSVSEALHCGSPGQPVLSGIFIAPLGLGLLRLILHPQSSSWLVVCSVQFALSKLWVIAELSVKLLCGPYISPHG